MFQTVILTTMNKNENSPFANEIQEVCYELLSKSV